MSLDSGLGVKTRSRLAARTSGGRNLRETHHFYLGICSAAACGAGLWLRAVAEEPLAVAALALLILAALSVALLRLLFRAWQRAPSAPFCEVYLPE